MFTAKPTKTVIAWRRTKDTPQLAVGRMSLNESLYLSTIYHDVFNDLGNTIAIYGWNMNDQDDHVLEKLGIIHRSKPFKKIAISVVADSDENSFIDRVTNKVHDKIDDQLKIDFYNSASSDCWNN